MGAAGNSILKNHPGPIMLIAEDQNQTGNSSAAAYRTNSITATERRMEESISSTLNASSKNPPGSSSGATPGSHIPKNPSPILLKQEEIESSYGLTQSIHSHNNHHHHHQTSSGKPISSMQHSHLNHLQQSSNNGKKMISQSPS